MSEEFLEIFLLLMFSYLYTCFFGYGCFVIYRLKVSKRSVFENKNYCEACDQPFHSIYSYPIVGYLLSKGQCANCGQKYGNKHLMMETLVFSVVYIILAVYGITTLAIVYSTLYLIFALGLYYTKAVKISKKVKGNS